MFSVEHHLDYAVGSGFNGLTFLIRRGRYLFQAPLISMQGRGSGIFRRVTRKLIMGLAAWFQECINCHAGRPAPLKTFPEHMPTLLFRSLLLDVRTVMDREKRM